MSKNISDFDLFHDLFLKDKKDARKAFRVIPNNLWIYLDGDNKPHKIHNVSCAGICFRLNSMEEQQSMTLGQVLTLHLFSEIKDEILTLFGKIVRIDPGLCSCIFFSVLNRDQTALDKIILGIQKKEIVQRREQRKEQEERKKTESDVQTEIKANTQAQKNKQAEEA